MKRTSPEWRDPTGNNAAFNIDRSNHPTSITEHKDIQPLCRFENDSDWRGRRRLLRELNKKLSSMNRGSKNWKQTKKEIYLLEKQQYTSRVGPEEVAKYTNRKRQRLKKHF